MAAHEQQAGSDARAVTMLAPSAGSPTTATTSWLRPRTTRASATPRAPRPSSSAAASSRRSTPRLSFYQTARGRVLRGAFYLRQPCRWRPRRFHTPSTRRRARRELRCGVVTLPPRAGLVELKMAITTTSSQDAQTSIVSVAVECVPFELLEAQCETPACDQISTFSATIDPRLLETQCPDQTNVTANQEVQLSSRAARKSNRGVRSSHR